MSGFELIIIGTILAFIGGIAWKNQDPKFLYAFAAFSAIAGVASSTGFQPAAEAPYAWGIAVVLVILGFVLSSSQIR